MLRSAIYEGPVVHERMRPRRHRLRYSVFSLLLDLDELPDLDRRFRLFGYNRCRSTTGITARRPVKRSAPGLKDT